MCVFSTILPRMGKYKHYLLLLVLFLFGPQGLANTLQTCSETAGETAPAENRADLAAAATECHHTEGDTKDGQEICNAQHCCPGATSSAVHPSGQALADRGKTRTTTTGHSYLYSGPDDIFHPPKLSL